MRVSDGIGLVLAALLVVACGEDVPGARSVVIDTVGRTVAVHNGPAGQWREGEGWRVRERWRTGDPPAEDGGDEDGLWFTNSLLGVSLGPTGQVCVLDFPADELTCLDGDGTNPRRLAGPGPGPGELENPVAMGWDEWGRLWVADGFRGRYTLFDSTGTFLKTVPRPIHMAARRQFPLVFEGGGTLIDETLGRGDEIAFLRVDTTGAVLDSLTLLPLTPAGRFPRLMLRPDQTAIRFVLRHYVPETRWAVAPDGTVWAARTDELRLFNVDLESGDTLRIVDTAHRNAGLTTRDEDRIREGLAEVGVDRDDVDLAHPVIQSLHVTGDGFVLVQVVGELEAPGRSYDVFDPEGVFLGTIQMPFGIADGSRADLVGDTILGVALGSLDEPYVVRATLVRPGV